mmetsp:Transcript_10174/g.25591  ORF Transcript_10174/g.25591 Transcript_10174/m.25591 type:complete len:206 (-) Transcript_10174:364-981(-)
MATSETEATRTKASACAAVSSSVSSSNSAAGALMRPTEASGQSVALASEPTSAAACRSFAVAAHAASVTANTPIAQMRRSEGSIGIVLRSCARTRAPAAAAATSSRSPSARSTKTAGRLSAPFLPVDASPRFITIRSSGRQQTRSSAPAETASDCSTPDAAQTPASQCEAQSSRKPPTRCENPSSAARATNDPRAQSIAHGSPSA